MKPHKTVLAYATNQNSRALIKALMLGLFAFNRNVKAQDILAPSPQAPDQTPTILQSSQSDEMDVFTSNEIKRESQPFTWEGLTLRPHPFYQFISADGIQANTNQVVNTTIQNISLGALLEIGRHWTLDYTPGWTIYSNSQLANNFGQTVQLTGGTVYKDWVLGLSQGYSDTSVLSAETATQVREQSYLTQASANYTLNSKMSLDLAADQKFISADQLDSYKEWATLDWFNYSFWSRLNAAIGLGGGYDHEDNAYPDMAFQQVEGRVNWRATDKISFQIHGGVEIRQFLSGGASDVVNPIFDASVQYHPFEQTKLTLKGERIVEPSYFENQVTENTSISLNLNQRLLGKVFLDLTGGYEKSDYIATLNNSTTDRTDDYDYLNVGLSRSFLKRGTFGVFYQISRDNSSVAGYSFTSNQIGCQIGFRY